MDSNFGINQFDNSMSMPFSLDAEQAVLGSILVEPSCLSAVQNYVRAEHFYLPQHKMIFSSIVSLDAQGKKIDPLIVLDLLVKNDVYDTESGRTYLFQLAQMVPSTSNVEEYSKIVREKFYIRELITVSKDIIESASNQEEEADLLLDNAEQKIYDIRQGKSTSGPSKLSDIIAYDVYDKLQKLTSPDKDKYKGYSTGFRDLDRVMTGLNKSDLVLIGARPAMGKTSFVLNMARNVAAHGNHKVVVFSLEMTKEQLALRVLSTEARIQSTKMRTGELDEDDWTRLGNAAAALSSCELYFDDSSNITVPEMKARIRRLHDVDCVFIDYLGLIRSSSRTESRVQEVSEITRSLKIMAKELNIPVVVCSQLSRSTEVRGKSHRPQLSDLRESGSIEQDADIVLMLYRDDYYKNDEDMQDPDEVAGANEVEIIVAKNRHGPTETVNLYWESDYTRFSGRVKGMEPAF